MVQHSGTGFELVQALSVPVLQVVEQPVEVVSFFRNSLLVVAEQVIEVPKLALPDGFLLRTFPLEPQVAEQWMEVPTLLQQQVAEQIVDNPVPRGRGARGGLPGFPPGQVSERTAEQVVDIPVPHTRRLHGGLQGSHPRLRTVELTVDIPVPFGGRPLHGFHTGQSSTAFTEQLVDTEIFKVFTLGRVQQRSRSSSLTLRFSRFSLWAEFNSVY